ncbi:hypothetical protein AX17_005267 [Amanita inopinata Kibby_2008]|nr:hypothetical protein AX17_005267 [Amanita inopinata Kibby_2008]
MDEAQSLDALANVINELSNNPHDIELHAKHIRLVQSTEGLQSEVKTAMEMLPEFLAAGEDVWLFLLDHKESSVDLSTPNGIEELLVLYERAEADYLSIPLLQRHLQFLLEQHSKYHSGEEVKPPGLGDIFTTSWTREAIANVVNKGIGHVTRSHLLWDKQREWEMEMLESSSKADREELTEHVQRLHLSRLRQPHSNSDETFQSYSTFTTNYKPPEHYEALLVAASKIRSQGQRAFERRENLEAALTQSGYSLEAYAQYLAVERRAKYPDLLILSTTYERALAEASRRRFDSEVGAETALRLFWAGYCDALRTLDASWDVQLAILKRAVRSVPGSGEVWARYIRLLERLEHLEVEVDEVETVEDIFTTALNTKLIQSDVDQLVAIILARAGYEKRRIEAGDDAVATLFGVLESGLEMVYQASKTGDVKLRLEKYFVNVYERIGGPTENVIKVWQSATKISKSSYLVWTSYIETLMKHKMHDEARAIFEDIHKKHLDWPEAIWELWISFEHLYGTVDQIDACLDKIEKAQNQVNARRAKEAEKASYQAMLAAMETQATNAAGNSANAPVETQMEVDDAPERGVKRAAEDDTSQNMQKKAKTEQAPAPLKRDRENCTVFVSDLPQGIAEDELRELFKDCGAVREVKITQLSKVLVATVEFQERGSVPAALTKDKKRIRGQEIAVHLAWKSTLYVTNFPETTDDASVREIFSKYGIIFDVRWPSKKLKSTRRFCYVQYTSPKAAEDALELHGQELEPNRSLNVFMSDPERKKARTDADADERELYVAGLSKFTTEADLEKVFKTYGSVKEVRLAKNQNGQAKGYAFVEFELEKDARAGLAANNFELKKRRIAVTMANSNIRSRHKTPASETGLSRAAEIRSRSVRIRNLPPGVQEGLLHQALEKITSIKRVEVFMDKQEAVAELSTAADAGRLLLRTEPFEFGGNILQLSEEAPETRAGAPGTAGGLFVPRRAGMSRPKAGLGHVRNVITSRAATSTDPTFVAEQQTLPTQGKGQEDFRKMLENVELAGRNLIKKAMNTESQQEYQESTSITFEWTLRGLKTLFDSTKGDHKSKVTKSPLFGGGRWQILFYANSGLPKDGGTDGNCVSLYLACEPTVEEKEVAMSESGRWVREGVYRFSFELRNTSKTITYNTKEAHNHGFSHKNANWGWAQFTRRDTIYYQAQNIKSQDALVIICTITSSPYAPPPAPSQPRRYVPKGLIDTVGSLLDDPLYSDVEFIIPRHPASLRNARAIWASRRMLRRAEYFDAMFSTNFAEGTLATSVPMATTVSQDSDQEDEDNSDAMELLVSEDDPRSDKLNPSSGHLETRESKHDDKATQESIDAMDQTSDSVPQTSSPRPPPTTGLVSQSAHVPEASKVRVVVRDTAYSTYRALLFYLYTDSIVFAPLSSSFVPSDLVSPAVSSTNVSVIASDTQGSSSAAKKSGQFISRATSRKDWIKEWCYNNPDKPIPCSAKAVYRLADRLGLLELKDRAAQHIYKSLTVDNIAYEVFSPFSATYDEIRKVLVDFFLSHWQDVRNSESMKTVWQQIRNGRHPGFEEVWPVVVQNLEFRPTSSISTNGSGSEDSPRLI